MHLFVPNPYFLFSFLWCFFDAVLLIFYLSVLAVVRFLFYFRSLIFSALYSYLVYFIDSWI